MKYGKTQGYEAHINYESSFGERLFNIRVDGGLVGNEADKTEIYAGRA